MDNLKERLFNTQPTYQQEQAIQRNEEREKEDKKLRKRKTVKDRKARQQQKFNETIAKLPVKIKEVHLDGLIVTKDVVVKNILSDILKATNYGEVLGLMKDAHKKLKRLGCFKRVDGHIDTSNEESGLVVTFKVQECNPLYGNCSIETSDNEANLHLFSGVKNITGNAESAEYSYLIGTHGTRKAEARYIIPLVHYLQKTATNRAAYFVTTVFGHRYLQTWSNLRLDDIGVKLGGVFQPFSWLKQSVQWRASWRELQPLSTLHQENANLKNAKGSTHLHFDAREMCGHTLKSSLIHKLSVDTRDDRVLPTSGIQATLLQELAGLSPIGTAAFFKTTFSASISKRISESLSISLSGATGFVSQMKDLDGRDITLMPQDRFLLGGPLILRGFAHKSVFYSQESRQGSISQNSERLTNAGLDCYLGGKAFWRTCAQFYFPMPYLRRKNNWIADNVKGHAFFECGSLGNPTGRSMLKAFGEEWTCLQKIRATCGVGLAVRLGNVGRAELNYCVPLRCQAGDRLQHGLQFGIGVEYS